MQEQLFNNLLPEAAFKHYRIPGQTEKKSLIVHQSGGLSSFFRKKKEKSMAQHGNSSTNVQVHTHAEGLLIMRIMLIIHIRL